MAAPYRREARRRPRRLGRTILARKRFWARGSRWVSRDVRATPPHGRPLGQFVPVWVEQAPGETGSLNIRQGEPEAPCETKAERGRRIARKRRLRAAHRLASEAAQARKSRMGKYPTAQMMSAGAREIRDEAAQIPKTPR